MLNRTFLLFPTLALALAACNPVPPPIEGREDIAGLICFFDERVDQVTVDGVPVESAA